MDNLFPYILTVAQNNILPFLFSLAVGGIGFYVSYGFFFPRKVNITYHPMTCPIETPITVLKTIEEPEIINSNVFHPLHLFQNSRRLIARVYHPKLRECYDNVYSIDDELKSRIEELKDLVVNHMSPYRLEFVDSLKSLELLLREIYFLEDERKKFTESIDGAYQLVFHTDKYFEHLERSAPWELSLIKELVDNKQIFKNVMENLMKIHDFTDKKENAHLYMKHINFLMKEYENHILLNDKEVILRQIDYMYFLLRETKTPVSKINVEQIESFIETGAWFHIRHYARRFDNAPTFQRKTEIFREMDYTFGLYKDKKKITPSYSSSEEYQSICQLMNERSGLLSDRENIRNAMIASLNRNYHGQRPGPAGQWRGPALPLPEKKTYRTYYSCYEKFENANFSNFFSENIDFLCENSHFFLFSLCLLPILYLSRKFHKIFT